MRGKTKSAGHAVVRGPTISDTLMGMALVATAAAFSLPYIAPDNPVVSTFAVIFSSIMLEAMPFMLLGTLVGGCIEVFVDRSRMDSLLPKSSLASACLAAAMGIVFPVCECAIVPVVRRLAGKGLPAAAAVAYLLAGPIVNPVVALSTAMAYNFDWRVAAIRLGLGYVIAVVVALVIDKIFRDESIFIASVQGERKHRHSAVCGCGHHHEHGHDHKGHNTGLGSRLALACNHALDDFMATAPYLVVGALIAALAQTSLDRRLLVGLASSSLWSSTLMMILAVLLNLCSEADAFIAASFRGLTPFSAQMAFLLIGPMFDIKLLLMYRNLFKGRVVPLVATLVVAAVSVAAIMVELAGGML
ncbi:MAG: permease [Planctomycetaceae bacterium]|nr:permease [Planctomycetaceae bacterium]